MAKIFFSKTRPACTTTSVGNTRPLLSKHINILLLTRKASRQERKNGGKGRRQYQKQPFKAQQLTEAETEVLIPIWKMIKNPALCIKLV